MSVLYTWRTSPGTTVFAAPVRLTSASGTPHTAACSFSGMVTLRPRQVSSKASTKPTNPSGCNSTRS